MMPMMWYGMMMSTRQALAGIRCMCDSIIDAAALVVNAQRPLFR
jgi:hypothetical protein